MNFLTLFNSKYSYQLLATFIVIILNTSHGIAIGWLSPALLYLESPEESPPFLVTVKQISWIGAMYGLGSLVGNILFGILLNLIGRKWCLCLMGIPHMCSWIMIIVSKSFVYLYVSRFLMGLTSGGNDFVMPLFISEIADPSIRGMLLATNFLFVSIGIFLGFVLSSQLDYYLSPCIIIVLSVVYLLAAVTQLPETPQYLLKKNKIEKAEKSFNFYKNIKTEDTHWEASSDVKENSGFEELKNDVCNAQNAEKLSLKDFANKKFVKMCITILVVLATREFSGAFAFLNYMSNIFEESGIQIDPNTCAIIIGAVILVGCICSILMVDRFGRKLLILISAGGMALGQLSLGFYLKYAKPEVRVNYDWLALLIMTLTVFCASLGAVSLVYTIILEIIPPRIRLIVAPISMMILSCMSFAALKLVPIIMDDYGLDVLVFGCGAVCVFCFTYLLIFLKETKGKNFDK